MSHDALVSAIDKLLAMVTSPDDPSKGFYDFVGDAFEEFRALDVDVGARALLAGIKISEIVSSKKTGSLNPFGCTLIPHFGKKGGINVNPSVRWQQQMRALRKFAELRTASAQPTRSEETDRGDSATTLQRADDGDGRSSARARTDSRRSVSPRKQKRSTERGEGRVKLIAALTQHHNYADNGCLNLEPIGNNELARLARVDKATASAFFKRDFKGHGKYKAACADATSLLTALKLLNGEFAPYQLYCSKPADEE